MRATLSYVKLRPTSSTWRLGGKLKALHQCMSRLPRFDNVAKLTGSAPIGLSTTHMCCKDWRQLMASGMSSTPQLVGIFSFFRFTSLLMSDVNSSKPSCEPQSDVSCQPWVFGSIALTGKG